ncbi:hypothetical protein LPJ61_007100 [Coemansia biformis]|uniref:Nudix hydrolase domain-containing protein n=1 Tax=Coemansia biformis TaxID=1286918 RepID=A0A9W8CMT9_9FUNG|nr:hypothetical protein LPJ61_007100 [Coemansia biformis]
MADTAFSILDIVRRCNCVDDLDLLVNDEGMYRFVIDGKLVGAVSDKDAQQLQMVSDEQARPPFALDMERRLLTFSSWCDNRKKRTAAVATVLEQLRASGAWASLAKWRSELYMVYGSATDPDGVSLALERAASYNFGIRTFGVHINGITKSELGQVRMWVARRSLQKQTWPGYLDQIAAGGIGDGMGVWESVIKECNEEGGIPREIACRAKYAGVIQYFTRSDLGLQPETQFVFDLVLPDGFTPYPNDGEVDSFHLWTIEEVIDGIKQDKFKPNCAVCIVHFLVRHGYLTAENEPDYLDIVDNLYVRLPFPAPRFSIAAERRGCDQP